MNIDMTFFNQVAPQYDEYEKYYLELSQTIFSYLGLDGYFMFEIDLVSNETIQEINRNYRNIDRVTDVISFAFEDNNTFPKSSTLPRDLGEIFISVDKAHQQAEEYGHTFLREMAFLFTHGLLHLLGYDHQNKEDEEKMFTIQKKVMEIIKL